MTKHISRNDIKSFSWRFVVRAKPIEFFSSYILIYYKYPLGFPLFSTRDQPAWFLKELPERSSSPLGAELVTFCGVFLVREIGGNSIYSIYGSLQYIAKKKNSMGFTRTTNLQENDFISFLEICFVICVTFCV